jgi:hypothetical protein
LPKTKLDLTDSKQLSSRKYNVWGKDGPREGEYHRHSVEQDILSFCGWEKLSELFEALRKWNPTYADVAIVAFKLAGRINEVLPLDNCLTKFEIEDDYIAVINYHVLKRFVKLRDRNGDPICVVTCKRCGTENDQYSVQCSTCQANLVFAGHRKYETVKKLETRLPFFIPRDEPFDEEFVRIIEANDGLLFPSPDPRREGKCYSYGWAYDNIKNFGYIVGLDTLFNHWFRGERLMQLRNEKDFDKGQLKDFSGILTDKTLDHYTKSVESYANKKLRLNISPEELERYRSEAEVLKRATMPEEEE